MCRLGPLMPRQMQHTHPESTLRFGIMLVQPLDLKLQKGAQGQFFNKASIGTLQVTGLRNPDAYGAVQVLECIAPGPDDIVLPKTSSSVFTSTIVDYILRSLAVKYLILAGCVTDQCVESAVREACDKHYYVTLVTGSFSTILSFCSGCNARLQARSAMGSRTGRAVMDAHDCTCLCPISCGEHFSCKTGCSREPAVLLRLLMSWLLVQMPAQRSPRSAMTTRCRPSRGSAGSARSPSSRLSWLQQIEQQIQARVERCIHAACSVRLSEPAASGPAQSV